MKNIHFSTGTLKITDDSINMQFPNGSMSMFRHQIGKVNVKEIKRIDKDPWIYGFRLGLGGIVIFLAGIFMEQISIAYAGGAGIILGCIIIFGDMIFDLMLGIPFIRPLLLAIVGYHCLHVVIQNTSGNNIEFETQIDHKKAALSIEKLRMDKVVEPVKIINEMAPSSASEVEKLHELFTKGIITEDEFNAKKKELLNL